MPGIKSSTRTLLLLGIILPILSSISARGQSSVRVWEEPLVLPTYRVGEPDRAPIFYSGRAYQGAKGAIYPYPIMDQLTDIRENHTYRAVYLENKFIKICVLPEIGGRIFSALDKTDNYDFIYHQHVIKPALIGMLGAWISGGVEWNIPHHHRASTFMTVDHTVEEHPDGSKTIWVGEIELRHRMKWLVGLTLYPDQSYLEATFKLYNRTPYVHSFLSFANVSVHADADYQVIFPPTTQFATYHGKNQFSRWPISTSVFNGVDYTRGGEVSWWKNHPAPTSWFCWNYQEDFFGGYDHGKHAGIVHVADHHVVPGKKFFEWGTGSEGALWDKILTETDGPYLELMAGAYSDNQPDYSWIQPYEVKTWKQYWYPIRQIEGIKNANLDAAVNLDVDPNHVAKFGFNATAEYRDAKAVLKAGGRVLLDETINIGPEKPYWKEFSLPAGTDPQSVQAVLLTSAGKELVSYSPVKLEEAPMPDPVKAPPAPTDIKTNEELYLTGLRLGQFYNPIVEPYPYYEEALRRDPGDVRVNTELGVLYCQRGMFAQAEERLRTALRRLTHDYTSPRHGEPLYYLGVALAGQEKYDAAYDAFYKATWSAAWRAPAYYALAQLACQKGAFAKALELVDASISANTLNTKALNLKAAVLRHLGRTQEAVQTASSILAADPLDFLARNELYLAKQKAGAQAEADAALRDLTVKMRDDAQSYLETAVDYGDCGLWNEAISVLSRFVNSAPDKSRVSPMVYYYLGYYSEQDGKAEEASRDYRLASQAPSDYCFPFRLESLAVLRRAMEKNPRDARAPYYLGNLLYDLQPEEAIHAWEQARDRDDSFGMAHRNLGLAYWRVESNLPQAVASMEKALARDRNNPRLYYELDVLYEAAGAPPEQRLKVLESNQETVLKRDDAVSQEIKLHVQLGRYDQALDVLTRRHFHTWEGGGDIHDVYVDACILRGEEFFRLKKYRESLRDFEAALDYPANLEVGKPYHDVQFARVAYDIGLAQEALGDAPSARQSFEKAARAKSGWSEDRYYQALALKKLGRAGEAGEIFEGLVKAGKELEAGSAFDYFAKFGEKQSDTERLTRAHYLAGLGYLGKGQSAEAKGEFEKVLAVNVNHLGARTQLADLK